MKKAGDTAEQQPGTDMVVAPGVAAESHAVELRTDFDRPTEGGSYTLAADGKLTPAKEA